MSTPQRIIIPSNMDGNGFLKNCYNYEFLNLHIKEEEFNSVVDHFSKLTEQAYSTKRKIDNKTVTDSIIYTFLGAFLLLIMFFFLYFYGTLSENKITAKIGIVCLGTSFLMVVVIMVKYALGSIPNFPTFEAIVKKDIENYFR
jgi:hypothetical protein